jgi:hypothetical protein
MRGAFSSRTAFFPPSPGTRGPREDRGKERSGSEPSPLPHLTEGQKAVLANEYRKILSKKRQSEAGKKAATIREIKRGNIDSDTVSESIKAEVDTRKIASDKFKVSEWKVRTVQEIEKKAPEVYEKLCSGVLQIHEAKIIARLPEGKREAVLEKKLETKKDIRSIIREVNNAEKNQNAKPLPEGKFSIIYADPPWELEKIKAMWHNRLIFLATK